MTTSPAGVRDLLRLQGRDKAGARPAFLATVEFAYLGDDGVLSMAKVHRDLRELVFLPGSAGSGQVWIRFPEACYLPRSTASGHPARLTYWALSGAVLLSVADVGYAGAVRPAPAPGTPTAVPGLGSTRSAASSGGGTRSNFSPAGVPGAGRHHRGMTSARAVLTAARLAIAGSPETCPTSPTRRQAPQVRRR